MLKDLRIASFPAIEMELTFPSMLLSWLLFSAGLGLSLTDVRAVANRPGMLLAGLIANLSVPLIYLAAISATLLPLMADDQRQVVITGLAIVAAVPIASSSTAWSQNANGNLALSLALVLFSTLLSPFTTPWVLRTADDLGPATADALQNFSPAYTVRFLICFVLIPIVAGIITRQLVGAARVQSIRASQRLANMICLLLLNYSNAAISLPQVVARTEGGFLSLLVLVTGLMCATAFGGAWAVARIMRADEGQRTALLFGMGMNNNGVGLVLASLALNADSRVLLPIILYNLWQHLIAGGVDHWMCRHDPLKKDLETERLAD